MSDCHGPSRSQPGQAFRIGTQEYAQAVLRTFMLLSVAGQCPTTKYRTYQPFGVGIFLPTGLGLCGSVGSVADCGDGGSGR